MEVEMETRTEMSAFFPSSIEDISIPSVLRKAMINHGATQRKKDFSELLGEIAN